VVRDDSLGGADIHDSSIHGEDLAARTITGREVNVSTFPGVPLAVHTYRADTASTAALAHTAEQASTASGLSNALMTQLTMHCLGSRVRVNDVCIDAWAQGSATWAAAESACNGQLARLPTAAELYNAASTTGIGVDAGGDISADLFQSGPDFKYIAVGPGGVLSSQLVTTPSPYRCVRSLTNLSF
jgi:hypothetical protein